jgi:hypothetical protein
MVDKTMQSRGYDHQNWFTKEFPGAAHTEKYWSERLDTPLTFLPEKQE